MGRPFGYRVPTRRSDFTQQFFHAEHEVSALSLMPDTNSATRAYGGTIFEKDGEVIRHGVRDMPCF